MNSRGLVTILCLVAVLGKALAQESSSFTQFYMNPYAVNSSYAGTDGRSALFLTYRKQWTGIDGAPTIMNLSYHTPVMGNVNFGMNANSDTRGILSTNSLLFSLGYTLNVSKDQYVRFGVSAGGSMNNLDIDQIDDQTLVIEPQLLNVLDQNFFLLGNVGVSYHNKYFNLGLSIPQIFEGAYTAFDNFTVGEIGAFDKLIGYASHRFYFGGDKYAFEPHIMYRYQKNVAGQIEAAGILHINHAFWIGGSYKQNFGIAGLGGVKMNDLFALGYSYGLKSTGANEINSPTHEIQLNYLFGKHKDKKHVYSFVNSKKPKKRRNRKKEALDKKREEERLAKIAAAEKEKEAAIAAELKRKEEERLAKEAADTAAKEAEDREQTAQPVVEEQTTPSIVEDPAPEPVAEEPAQEASPEPTHVRVKKGVAKDELQEDHYVVVGSFASKQQAEAYKKRLADQGITSHDGYSSHLHRYYVYTLKTASVEEARAERDRIRKTEQFKDAWHLEVHHDDVIEVGHESSINEQGDAVHTFTTDKPVILKKGSHILELEASEYVVVGTFGKFENAEKYSDDLFKKGYKANFGYSSSKALWYVYLLKTTDSDESRTTRNNYRKNVLFNNAWVLTIID
jgi:type IX secretion system PorP/SprF family membrane protein